MKVASPPTFCWWLYETNLTISQNVLFWYSMILGLAMVSLSLLFSAWKYLCTLTPIDVHSLRPCINIVLLISMWMLLVDSSFCFFIPGAHAGVHGWD